ncbi:MAG: oligopeptide ABC transporter permease OppB [Parvularculaceae bacterium]
MTNFIINRLLISIPTFFIIITLSFFLMRVAPGGPFDADADLDPAVIENLRTVYGLDKPLLQQYLTFLGDLAHGDLGLSLSRPGQSVSELMATAFPVSIKIGISAIILAVLIGGLSGVIAALNQNSVLDYTVMTMAMTGVAIPNFVTAPILTLIFGLYLNLLPIAGWNDGALRNMILPVIALALPQIAGIARIMRGGMLDVMRSDFIRTARSKGLPEHKIILRHALKTASIPLVSYLGPAIAGIMTGSVVIEVVFALPGVGRLFVEGAVNRDYPVVMGVVIVYAAAILILNFLADVLYGYLDPRTRRSK